MKAVPWAASAELVRTLQKGSKSTKPLYINIYSRRASTIHWLQCIVAAWVMLGSVLTVCWLGRRVVAGARVGRWGIALVGLGRRVVAWGRVGRRRIAWGGIGRWRIALVTLLLLLLLRNCGADVDVDWSSLWCRLGLGSLQHVNS